MKVKKIRLLAFALMTAALCGCVTNTAIVIEPQSLRNTTATGRIGLLENQIVVRNDFKILSYTLPAGPYFPLAEDNDGIYYMCASGIISKTDNKREKPLYLHIPGGIYIPHDSSADAKFWTVVHAKALLAGKLRVDQDEATEMVRRCSDAVAVFGKHTEVDGAPPFILVDVVPIGPGAKSINMGQRLGTSAATSFVLNLINDAVLSINDGKVMIPEVHLENGKKLRESIVLNATEPIK